MGRNRKNRRERFFELHPICCFCGGNTVATTEEHAPQISFFIGRQLPANSHVFPACERCNHGTKHFDQVASLMAMMQRTMIDSLPHDDIDILINGVANNYPEVFNLLYKDTAKDLIVNFDGIDQEVVNVEFDPLLFEAWLDPWAAKQAFALYYKHCGRILDENARVVIRWLTNSNLLSGNIPIEFLDSLENIELIRQGKKTSDLQYEYRWSAKDDFACFSLLLHDTSIAIAAVYENQADANKHFNLPVFATSLEKGIHRVSNPWFTVGPYNM